VCQLLPHKLGTHPGLLQETKIVAAVAQSHHFAAINLHVLEQLLYTVTLGCILQALNDIGKQPCQAAWQDVLARDGSSKLPAGRKHSGATAAALPLVNRARCV
jgi:hypothetical protein